MILFFLNRGNPHLNARVYRILEASWMVFSPYKSYPFHLVIFVGSLSSGCLRRHPKRWKSGGSRSRILGGWGYVLRTAIACQQYQFLFFTIAINSSILHQVHPLHKHSLTPSEFLQHFLLPKQKFYDSSLISTCVKRDSCFETGSSKNILPGLMVPNVKKMEILANIFIIKFFFKFLLIDVRTYLLVFTAWWFQHLHSRSEGLWIEKETIKRQRLLLGIWLIVKNKPRNSD